MKKTTFIETFDNGPCGWMGWDRTGATRFKHDHGMIESRGPWWVDVNHAPPGAGYLHILFALHTFHWPNYPQAMFDITGPNPFVEKKFPTDFRNAKVTVRIRGELKNLHGAQLAFHAQGNISKDETKPNWVNQVLVKQPITVTRDWSEQTITLVPDPSQWADLGSRHDRTATYGRGSIETLLGDLNGNFIFVLFPLEVIPLKPIQGDPHTLRADDDYPVDRSRLPEGHVQLDTLKIEFA